MKHKVLGIYQGKVKQSFGMNTAMEKQPVDGQILVTLLGLQGDECAEKRFHGGAERALHQYPAEHYVYWQKAFGETSPWQPAGMGENISTLGMLETNVYIGDRYQWGEALIEVSQPRSPCYKLNKRWNVDNFAEHMQTSGRSGWLYRVLKPGKVDLTDSLILVEREDCAMSVSEVSDLFFNQPLCRDGLNRLASQHRLSESWLSKVKSRLANNQVENWQFRLHGKP